MPWITCTQCTQPSFAERYAPYEDYVCHRCLTAEVKRLEAEVEFWKKPYRDAMKAAEAEEE